MINEYNTKKYCCEDISLIENYDKAVNDSQMWVCHHRNGIILNKTPDELKAVGLYENRPACELIFLTESEHIKLHNIGKQLSQETRKKLSESHKGKKCSKKTRNKISVSKTGKKRSDEARKAISIGGKKRFEKQEERDKASNIAKKRFESPEEREKSSQRIKKHYESQEARDKASKAQRKRYENQEERDKISLKLKGKQKTKYLWQTPNGEIIIQSGQAKRWHPDWICLETAKP